MLSFFKDAQLQNPVTMATPKRFLVPTTGGVRTSSLWLADPYTAQIAEAAAIGANLLTLDQTFEFLPAGTVLVNGTILTYTGKTPTTLTGVTGITASILAETVAVPRKVYIGTGNLTIGVAGADLGNVRVSLKSPSQTSYPITFSPAIFPVFNLFAGSSLQVNLQVSAPLGPEMEFSNWMLTTCAFYVRDASNLGVPNGGDSFFEVEGYGYLSRRDDQGILGFRLLPAARALPNPLPGFKVGTYRWRDLSTINAVSMEIPKAAPSASAIGLEKFVPGIGYGDDLRPLDLEEVNDNILLRVNRGMYFTGAEDYYFNASTAVDIFPVTSSAGSYKLTQAAQPLLPIYVGTWARDARGYFEASLRYENAGAAFDATNPNPQYTLDSAGNLSISAGLASATQLVGLVQNPPQSQAYLPLYPIASIARLYIDNGVLGTTDVTGFQFDQEQNLLTFTLPPSAVAGDLLMIAYNPAIAVVYDTSSDPTRLLTEIDLNPAVSGLSSGVLYLEHRTSQPSSLLLSCDKPLISIPATHDSIIGITAYGPVYFDGDYALLTVTASGDTPGELISGVRLVVTPGPNFSGLLNYQNPQTSLIQAVTGGDGTANFVYTPAPWIGTYLDPATSIATTLLANDSLILPQPVPISELWNSQEGWLVTTYTVLNNNPLLGQVGGNRAQGAVPWAVFGTPGTLSYRTNGQRQPWQVNGVQVYPLDARDLNNRSYTDPLFSGNVDKLVYPLALGTASPIGSYFLTWVQRVTLSVSTLDDAVTSSTLLLQMAVPPVINDNPWLILNDQVQGLLNQYRLGWYPAS